MNTKLFYLSLVELAVDLVIGVLVLFIVYKIFTAWFKKKYQPEENNLAFRILMAAVLFASGYCISGALQPTVTTFKLLQTQGLSTGVFVWECIKYVIIFIALGLIISLAANFITLMLYNLVTRDVDELQEIAKGTISYAVFMGVIVIIISLFTRDAYVNMMESLVPYPDIPVLPR